VLAFVSLIALTPAVAGQQGPGAQAQAQKSEPVTGELRSIDVSKKTLTISEGDRQQIFMYTDMTKVSGAQGGIEPQTLAAGARCRRRSRMASTRDSKS
jgi:Cu/Ag efflux protein CusF